MSMYVRIQEKGQVTIPTKIRKKLNLRKGDVVMFVETEAGVLIKPAEVILTEALDELGKAFHKEGMTLEQWIERGRAIREKLVEEEYDLKEK